MLQSMRNLAQSWIIKGLMLFLMVSFCLWGIGDIFRGNPMGKTVTKIGDTAISVQQLNQLFEQALAQARQRLDPAMTAHQAKELGLLDKVLDNAIKRALVDQDVKRLGLDVSPKQVLEIVAQQPQFKNKDGSFNKDLFRQLLAQQQMSESAFLTQGQQEMSRQLWLAALNGSRIVPQTELDALYKARARKRSLEVVTIDASKIGGIAAPDDKALHDFYDKHADLFTAPEYRGVTVALLTIDSIAKDIVISDDQLKKEYDSKLNELAQPERRDVLQVVAQDEAKARALAAQARSSGDLSAAAKQNNETAIPLNGLEEKSLMPELSKEVFTMKEGQIGDPVKTQLGWHVIQLKKITAAGTPGFDSVKAKMREDMRRDQAVEASTKIVNQIDDELAAGHALEDIADELRLRLIKVPALDVTGAAPDGKPIAELPNKNEVVKDAFAQNSGESSPVEDDKSGTYYVVRTDEITPSGVRPFDSVKADIAAKWKAQAQIAKAQEQAAVIAKALQDGKAPDSFAGQEGVTVRLSNPISQLGDTDPLLPASILSQIFKLKKGETASAADGNKQIVVRLASIADADASKADPRKANLAADVRKSAPDELLDEYVRHLYVLFPVKTNQELFDTIRQQDN